MSRRRSLAGAIVSAGAVAAVAEMMLVLPVQAVLSAPPIVVFQSMAGGFLGRAAYRGGLRTLFLGMVIHLLVCLLAAAVFVLAATRWEALLRRPAAFGAAYGVLIFLVMTYLLPGFSAMNAAAQPSPLLTVASLAIHILAFGLPIAGVSWALLATRD